MARARRDRLAHAVAAITLMTALLTGGCSVAPKVVDAQNVYGLRERTLWDATVRPYLLQPLWDEDEAYDAGHHLMVPLHAAFTTANGDWREQFHRHFAAYAEEIEDLRYANRLNEMHYLYLASRYVALCYRTGQEDRLPANLTQHLLDRTANIWTAEPAGTWGHEAFTGVRERLAYKLPLRSPKYGYYAAVVDEDLLLFGIAADLTQALKIAGEPTGPELDEILASARLVFTDEVSWNGGLWLLQPGVWADHPDYAQAGRSAVASDMTPVAVPGIAGDTSHAHRLPLILTSLLDASRTRSDRRLYANLLASLERRMFDKVLVAPDDTFDAWRTTNYMDGRNGFFRWEYVTQGENNGYGPYELSGTLNLGWWGFLRTSRIRLLYHDQVAAYPLRDNVLETYVGPNTTRARNTAVQLPAAYENGLMELIARLASTL